MKLLYQPDATVGQIVQDLERIVAKAPGIFLEYLNDDGQDMFVEGIKLRKDIAILETTGRKRRAARADDLLAMLRRVDATLCVVIQDGWEMRNLEPNAEGSIFRYNEEEEFCEFLMDRDVRLLTTQEMVADLKEKGWDKFLDYKVAAASRSRKMAVRVNSLQWRHGKLCLCFDREEDTKFIKLGDFLEQLPDCAEFTMMFGGRYYTVDVDEKGIFIALRNEEGNHVGLYIGELVYDPEEEWE